MQQDQNPDLLQRFEQYRASKRVLLWSCAGSAILTIVIGFSWGGWVTGGTAREMAANSAAQARQELAAVICVDRFMAATDAGVKLAALKEITSSYGQSKFVEDGGWAIIVPASATTADYKAREDDRKAAGLCAAELAKRELAATQSKDETAVAQ
jgi:hypothetical protein